MNIQAIKSAIGQVYRELPQDTGRCAIGSFLWSFTWVSLLTNNRHYAVTVAAAATVASLMHACTTPIFKKMAAGNPDPTKLTLLQGIARVTLSQAAAACVLTARGYRPENIAIRVARTLVFVYMQNGFNSMAVSKGVWY